ncbi:MAG: hypothetical protein ABI378_15355 [Chitinophagaceae bacterium]
MKHLFIVGIVAALAFAQTATGQPQYRNQERIGTDGKTYSEREMEKVADRARTPNTPSTNKSQYGWEKRRNEAAAKEKYQQDKLNAEAEKASKAKYEAADAVRIAEAKAYNKQYQDKVDAAAARASNENTQAFEMLMGAYKRDYTGLLTQKENDDIYANSHYMIYQNRKIRYDKESFKAITAFRNEQDTGSYERLLRLAKMSGRYAETTTNELTSLLKRFPEKKEAIERAQLELLPYYFGRWTSDYNARPDYNSTDNTIPKSLYERGDVAYRDALLAIFQEYSAKYPDLAAKAVGSCRPRLNPYLLLAEKSSANEAQCGAFHLLVLQSDCRDITISREKEFQFERDLFSSYNKLADYRLRESAKYLLEHNKAELRAFTKDDWRRIAEKQGLPINSLSNAFRTPRSDDNDYAGKGRWQDVKRSIPALWAAIDEACPEKSKYALKPY